MWPQIIMIIFAFLTLTLHAVKHGQERDEEYNFFLAILFVGLELWLLYMGGFFDGFSK